MSEQPTETSQDPAPASTPAPASAPPAEPDKGHVPYSRFADKVQEVAELRAKVEALTPFQARAAELESTFKTAQATWTEERAFLASGITDAEAQDVARLCWNRLATDARPEGGMAVWLETMKADPSTAPKALAVYLAPSAPPTAAVPTAPSRVGPSAGKPPTGGSVTAEALAEAQRVAMQTRDWKPYHALRDAYMESVRSGR